MFDLIESIVEFIREQNLGFALVDFYRNEFSDNSGWNPVFPCCLVKFQGLQAAGTFADGTSISERATIIIYVAQRYDPSYDQVSALELADSLYDALADYSNDTYRLSQESVEYVSANYGTDVYQLTITAV